MSQASELLTEFDQWLTGLQSERWESVVALALRVDTWVRARRVPGVIIRITPPNLSDREITVAAYTKPEERFLVAYKLTVDGGHISLRKEASLSKPAAEAE